MKPVSFYLVTDTHYLDNKLEPGGEAFEKNMVTEQFFVKESGAIISSTFDKIVEDKETDIVILPGDLVKNGEKYILKNHTEKMFSKLESKYNAVVKKILNKCLLNFDGKSLICNQDEKSVLANMVSNFIIRKNFYTRN